MACAKDEGVRRNGTSAEKARGGGSALIAASGLRGCGIGVLLIGILVITGMVSDAMPTAAVAQSPPSNDDLVELTEQYLNAADEGERRTLLSAIEESAGGSVDAVSVALRAVRVWEARPSGVSSSSFETSGGQALQVAYRIPKFYDSTRRYPLVVALPDGHESTDRTVSRVVRMFGARSEDFVLVVVPERVAFGPNSTGTALADLLRAVRRWIHIDSDRVFLLGVNQGADAAWMMAIQEPDHFAGVVCLSGYPNVVYPAHMYPIILSNLERLPVLSVWRRVNGSTANGRERAVASHNQLIASLAERANISFTGMAVSAPDRASVSIPPALLEEMLARRRSDPPAYAARWFRYPAHGRAVWSRQTRFKGDVWTADQLSILPAARVDYHDFIDDVIKSKLAYLSSGISGQTITLETCRCARVELLLSQGLIDLTKPVTVICNGRRRHRGTLEPSIETMLEYARDEWVFERLPVAKLTISIRTDHDFGRTGGIVADPPKR